MFIAGTNGILPVNILALLIPVGQAGNSLTITSAFRNSRITRIVAVESRPACRHRTAANASCGSL